MIQSLSLIGVGAFGGFAVSHLKPHFDITLYDPHRDMSEFENSGVSIAQNLTLASQSDIIILAIPVPVMEQTIRDLAPHLRAGQLVMDIASVKVKPSQWMRDYLPNDVDIIATHPIFGPESGKNGIEGQIISLANIRGDRLNCVEAFCTQKLGLKTIITTAEKHDQEMAYVQGLTHLIAKILGRMDIPQLQQTTTSYNHLCQMADMIKNDSNALFHVIQNDNPYVRDVTDAFFEESQHIEKSLHPISDD